MFYTIFVFVRVVVFISFFFWRKPVHSYVWGLGSGEISGKVFGEREREMTECWAGSTKIVQVCDILTSCTRYISETNDPTILL